MTGIDSISVREMERAGYRALDMLPDRVPSEKPMCVFRITLPVASLNVVISALVSIYLHSLAFPICTCTFTDFRIRLSADINIPLHWEEMGSPKECRIL